MDRLLRRAGFLQQLAGLDLKRIGDLTKDRDTGGHIAALDGADISHTQARPVGEFFLRQLFVMTCATQIPRHDLLEIHGERGTSIGTIILGMIVPIRVRACYSLSLPDLLHCVRVTDAKDRIHAWAAPA